MTTTVDVAVAAGAPVVEAAGSRDGFVAGWDDDEGPMGQLGPGDSHYELTFTLGEASGETDAAWPAFSGVDGVADEGPSGEFVAPGGRSEGWSDPWSYRLITSSGRVLFFLALGFAALSLGLLGFLLIRILGGSPSGNSTTLALIIGSVAAVSFLFVSLSLTALNLLLAELARSLRRQRDPSERETGIVRG
jgi:hypothetical protein